MIPSYPTSATPAEIHVDFNNLDSNGSIIS
jgi:hypothetical protein